jgi:hypothetical protein
MTQNKKAKTHIPCPLPKEKNPWHLGVHGATPNSTLALHWAHIRHFVNVQVLGHCIKEVFNGHA